MSEQPSAPPPARRENVFTHKLGPLPMWIWVFIVGGIIIAWALYKSRTTPRPPAAPPAGGPVPADQVPQFVNQTFTTVTPPSTTINVAEEPERQGSHIKPQPKRKPHNPPNMDDFYTVRPGDTLNGIAKRFGISRVVLAHANGLGTGAGVRAGTRLRIPREREDTD